MEFQKLIFLNAYFSVSAVMFCEQFLANTVRIDLCNHSIHKHSSRSEHILYQCLLHALSI